MPVFSEQCGRRLVEHGFSAYYAFSTARDMLLRRSPRTVNILTSADLAQLSRLFPELRFRQGRSEHAFLGTGAQAVRFYSSDCAADRPVSIPGLADGNHELLRRALRAEPFLVNSFFYDIGENIFRDPLDSYPLLKTGTISTRSAPAEALEEHPNLAILTALAYTETGFSIDPDLMGLLDRRVNTGVYRAPGGDTVAAFRGVLASREAYRGMVLLDRWGVLDELLPELGRLKLVEQDKDHHPEGDAFRHTLHCLQHVKKPTSNLMMALLLHDTGKAVARSGRTSRPFPNHAGESRKIAARVLERFQVNGIDREEILFLVQNHMILNRVSSLHGSQRRELLSSPYFPNLLQLFRADIESGYHRAAGYHHAAREYRAFLREQRQVAGIVVR
ncbi:MAG: HD domain-containing protein [Spirochaetota bacterium]